MFSSDKRKWDTIKKELGIISIIENGVKNYYVSVNKFLSKFKDKYTNDIVYSNVFPKTEVIIQVEKWEDFKLSKASLIFLENSKRGVSFIGIGDIKNKILHVHPLVPDNMRTVPAANASELVNYDGVYDSTSLAKLPIIHNFANASSSGLKEGKDFITKGTTSHGTLFNLLTGKMLDNENNYFGFSVLDTGKDESGKWILTKEGLKKASFRVRSNSFNNLTPLKMKIIIFKDQKDKEYLKLGSKKILEIDKIEKVLLSNSEHFPLLSQNMARKLSKTISYQINNKRLKESLLDFDKNDVFI